MAEYQAPMAEKLRKSVGNVTYYIMHGKTFARAKVAHVKTRKPQNNFVIEQPSRCSYN